MVAIDPSHGADETYTRHDADHAGLQLSSANQTKEPCKTKHPRRLGSRSPLSAHHRLSSRCGGSSLPPQGTVDRVVDCPLGRRLTAREHCQLHAQSEKPWNPSVLVPVPFSAAHVPPFMRGQLRYHISVSDYPTARVSSHFLLWYRYTFCATRIIRIPSAVPLQL